MPKWNSALNLSKDFFSGFLAANRLKTTYLELEICVKYLTFYCSSMSNPTGRMGVESKRKEQKESGGET